MKERRKQLFSLLMSLVLLLALVPMAAVPAAAADDDLWTADASYYDSSWYDPAASKTAYTINGADQLAGLAFLVNDDSVNFEGVTLTLASDVDLSEHLWTPIGTEATPFKGTFEGGGHTVSGMRCGTSGTLAGLFGVVNGGAIQNVTVSGTVSAAVANPDANNPYYVYIGGVAARMDGAATLSGCVSRCTVTATLHGAKSSYIYVGGVAGQVDSGSAEVQDCANEGSVSLIAAAASGAAYDITGSESCVGGVAGQSSGLIASCRNTAPVAATVEAAGTDPVAYAPTAAYSVNFFLGGVAGESYGAAKIVNCVNTGSVTSAGSIQYATVLQGGVVGFLKPSDSQNISVRNSYNLGAVTRTDTADFAGVGGVVGLFQYASGSCLYLENCYSAASSVSAPTGKNVNVGGIVGKLAVYSGSAAVNNCYWLASGTPRCGVFEGFDGNWTAAACGSFADADGALTAATTAQGFPSDQTLTDTTLLDALNAWVADANAATPPFSAWCAPSVIAGVSSAYPGFEQISDPIPIYPTAYPVTLPENVEGGTVISSHSYAVAGAAVTITPKPNEGQRVDELTVTDRSGAAVAVAENTDGTYTFKQPSGGSVVAVSFKSTVWNNPFDDIKENDWFYDDVRYVFEKGLMQGTDKTVFSPADTTTRGMIVAMLYRLAGEPEVTGDCPFDDVAPDSYYEKAITWAAANGVVGGYGGGKFGPEDPITREQLAAVLYGCAKYMGYDTTQGGMAIREYDDYETISPYATEAMAWCVNTGILQGDNNKLAPKGNATRAQAAATLRRFCENAAK